MYRLLNGNLKGKLSVGQGDRGKSLEFKWEGTKLGVRVEGDLEYQFVELGVEGGLGKEVQLQVSNGYIQWKYADALEWTNLIALTELKGEKGEKGEQGLQGEQGVTPNIQIGTVTTLEPNQQATVTNTGTKENPIFNFGIPKGKDGASSEGDNLAIDNDTISDTKTWSSAKIEDFVLSNDNAVWLDADGENVKVDSTKEGYLREIEVWGNTTQGFADCVTPKEIVDSINAMGFNTATLNEDNTLSVSSSTLAPSTTNWSEVDKENFLQLKPNTTYSVYCGDGTTFFKVFYTLYEEQGTKSCTDGTNAFFTTKASGKVLLHPGALTNKLKVHLRVVEGEHRIHLHPIDYGLSDIKHLGEPTLDGRNQYKIEINSYTSQYQNQLKDPNLTTNPFSNTTVEDGWNIIKSKLKETTYKKEMYSTNTQKTYKGDILYCRFDIVKLKNVNITSNSFCYRSGGHDFVYVSPTEYNQLTVNKQYTLSSRPSFGGPDLYAPLNITFKVNGMETEGEDIFKIKDVILLNLTQLYGKGNEPTKEWCDANIKYTNHNEVVFEPNYKTTLLLPCQLMKVGNVSDRLYWDSEKGRYIVEKNINTKTYDGSSDEPLALHYSNSLCFNLGKMGDSSKTGLAISDRVVGSSTVNSSKNCVSISLGRIIYTQLDCGGTPGEPNYILLQTLRNYLGINPLTVYYPVDIPQLIETNIKEQIKLPTYKDITFVTVNGGVQGTVKVKAPVDGGKVIGSLVQENKELKALNTEQDNLINTTMLATDRLYTMLEPLLVNAISDETNDFVDMYAYMVQRGLKDLEDVPLIYKEKVKELTN